MLKLLKNKLFLLTVSIGMLAAPEAFAHEAYVLDKNFFWAELGKPASLHALDALKSPDNLRVTITIALSVFVLLGLNFVFRRSGIGRAVSRALERLSSFGPLFVRAAIAAAFWFSAASWSFLGPELPLHAMPLAQAIRVALFVISICIAAGLLTEIAAFAAFIIFTAGFFVFGAYLLTYLNYLGEIIALLLFGMRTWSIDRLLFGPHGLFQRWKKYETTIVRVCYGAALAYAAVTVKFLHPALTVKVVNDWNLAQFHWLFPRDPLLVTLGAGLSELAIGLFILSGFELRLTVFISLFYITLSLLYFRELVWPHLMLYGISLNLLVQPETFTLDHLLFARRKECAPNSQES